MNELTVLFYDFRNGEKKEEEREVGLKKKTN